MAFETELAKASRKLEDLRDPEAYADACVTLLSPAGAAWRGTVWDAAASDRA